MPTYLPINNIFETGADCLVNPVNTVGVMGKGLALQFKCRFPKVDDAYRELCLAKAFDVGQVLVFKTEGTQHIVCFPTKQHWFNSSKIEYIDSGMVALTKAVKEFGFKSVAIPQLGCGLGGLDWKQVKPLILKYTDTWDTVKTVYL